MRWRDFLQNIMIALCGLICFTFALFSVYLLVTESWERTGFALVIVVLCFFCMAWGCFKNLQKSFPRLK